MEKGLEGHFVGLTIFFGGFAEGAIFGCHEEDGGDEGFFVGREYLRMGDGGFQLSDEGVLGGFVPAERGAKQHEGLEMGLAVGSVELQVIENAAFVKALLVLTLGLRCFSTKHLPAEDGEKLLFHVLHEVRGEDLI